MNTAAQRIFDDALTLGPEEKVNLAERLIESIDMAIEPAIEQSHIQIVRNRRSESPNDWSNLIDGADALARIRKIIAP